MREISGIAKRHQESGNILVLLIFLVVGFFLVRGAWNFGYDKFGPKTYIAFFYHDPYDLSQHLEESVDSIEDCRDWVSAHAARDFDGEYDYECGVNCKFSSELQLYKCKESIE